MSQLTRGYAIYSAICVLLWLISILSPLNWTAKVIQSDIHHMYNDAFYGCLLTLGLLGRLPKQRKFFSLIFFGGIAGLMSSMIAIALVVLVGPNSFSSIFKPTDGPYPWFLEYIFYCAVILLGPLWGVIAAGATYLGRRTLSSSE